MREAGFDGDTIAAVAALLRKEGLARAAPDSDVQALEDCACLVFLDRYFAPFADKHPPAKVADILARTWRKMSPAAQRVALGINYPASVRALLRTAGIASA